MSNITASVVLVGTKHTYNIGLVSRVMSNYGLDELILVAPRCEIDVDAYHGAAGGNEPLKKLVRVSDWSQFLTIFPPGYRLGFYRRMDQPFTLGEAPLQTAVQTLREHMGREHMNRQSVSGARATKIYLVFGREDSGLSNEDLQMMNGTMTFPTWGYPSMSLSHAVTTGALLFCLARETGLHLGPNAQAEAPIANVVTSSATGILEKEATESIRSWLLALGLSLETPNNAAAKFVALLRRSAPNPEEWGMIKKLVFQTTRKLGPPPETKP